MNASHILWVAIPKVISFGSFDVRTTVPRGVHKHTQVCARDCAGRGDKTNRRPRTGIRRRQARKHAHTHAHAARGRHRRHMHKHGHVHAHTRAPAHTPTPTPTHESITLSLIVQTARTGSSASHTLRAALRLFSASAWRPASIIAWGQAPCLLCLAFMTLGKKPS